MTMTMSKINDSFRGAYDRVPYNERTEVRNEIMGVLGITSPTAWRNRLAGKIEHTRSEAEQIETVFRRHGITKIWG